MKKALFRVGSFTLAAMMVAVMAFIVPQTTKAAPGCDTSSEVCYNDGMLEFGTTVGNLPGFSVPKPAWQNPPAAAQKPKTGRVVTYSVTTKGTITASLAEFKQQANQTLNDSRGWSRLGVSFSEVASGGDFTLVLSEASQLPTYSDGCTADYSCNVGRNVIINQDRWLGATPSWNNAGGSLRDYRHMVVNHETGHWLGHSHANCGGPGQPAPLMQQQSIDLQSCTFNPWPLDSELTSSRLGIS